MKTPHVQTASDGSKRKISHGSRQFQRDRLPVGGRQEIIVKRAKPKRAALLRVATRADRGYLNCVSSLSITSSRRPGDFLDPFAALDAPELFASVRALEDRVP